VSSQDIGAMSDLKRHLICVDRSTGKMLWDKTVPIAAPEDRYSFNIAEHGYASNTPATDGTHVYAFFGKTGVVAFDMSGNQLWQTSVGTGSSNRRWGSAAGVILYKNLVIVNAADESRCIYALDKTTGKEVWKDPGAALELSYCTPAIVDTPGGGAELVIAVPGYAWGMDPETGNLHWYASTPLFSNVAPSVLAGSGIVYLTGGFPGSASVAIRTGGKGNVTKTHTVWQSENGSYIPTPLVHGGYLYWVDAEGSATCADARTGKLIYQERLGARYNGKPVYASVVLAGDRIYAVSRSSGTYVFRAGPKFEPLARNQLASDTSGFNATPAIVDNQLLIRSNKCLYCIEAGK